MRILGLDPGSRFCGYGVIDDTGATMRYVECGLLTAPAGRPMEARLGEIARGLREVIDELAPDVVAVEDVFMHQNPRSALALAQARGMALPVIGLAGLSVASYPPAVVKKAVSGSGGAPTLTLIVGQMIADEGALAKIANSLSGSPSRALQRRLRAILLH